MSLFTFIIRLKGAGQNTFDDLLYLEECNFKGTKNPLILMRTFSYEAERYRKPKVTALRKIAFIYIFSPSLCPFASHYLGLASFLSHAHEQ